MQHNVKHGEKGKVEVKVDVSRAEFNLAYDEVLAILKKDSKIPGFRPGNIPTSVVEDKIGINKILNDAASFLVNKHLDEIFKAEKIIPLGSPNVAVHSLAKDSAFSFSATLVAKPQIKIGAWKKMKLDRIKPKVISEKDVNASIKNIYDAWKKQEEAKGVKAPESAEENEDSGKKFIYDARGEKVFLKDDEADIKKKQEGINDEFAKKIGARDLTHLQELVRLDLEKIVAGEVEAKLEEEIFDEILKLTEVEIPDILVDDELNRILLRVTQNMESQNKKLEDYLAEQNTTLDAFKAKMRPQAEKNVKITLIMDEIGKQEKVQISKEEIENAAKNVDESKLTEVQKQDLRNYMAVSIFQSKTLDLVKKTIAA